VRLLTPRRLLVADPRDLTRREGHVLLSPRLRPSACDTSAEQPSPSSGSRPLSARFVHQRTSTSPVQGARVQDSALITSIVRREIQGTEARVSAQVTRIQEDLAVSIERTDRLREAALQRLEQRILGHESMQFKLDRKVSELSGVLRGLAEETQIQIRRVDAADCKQREFRQKLEEEFREKWSEQHAVLNKFRTSAAAADDAQRRLSQSVTHLEKSVQEYSQAFQIHTGAMEQNFASIEERLSAMDEARLLSSPAPSETKAELFYAVCRQSSSAAASAMTEEHRLWQLERQLADVTSKVENLTSQAHGDRGWNARLEEHEVRLAGIRSKLQATDKASRVLREGGLRLDATPPLLGASQETAFSTWLPASGHKTSVMTAPDELDGASTCAGEIVANAMHTPDQDHNSLVVGKSTNNHIGGAGDFRTDLQHTEDKDSDCGRLQQELNSKIEEMNKLLNVTWQTVASPRGVEPADGSAS